MPTTTRFSNEDSACGAMPDLTAKRNNGNYDCCCYNFHLIILNRVVRSSRYFAENVAVKIVPEVCVWKAKHDGAANSLYSRGPPKKEVV